MNKRLLKRHKRQVARAKERVKCSCRFRPENSGTNRGGTGGKSQCGRPAKRPPHTLLHAVLKPRQPCRNLCDER